MQLETPLETEHLSLSTLSTKTANSPYLDWINDPIITQYLEIRFCTFTHEELVAFITEMNASDNNLLLGIHLKHNHRHIGNIKLGPIIHPHQRADIGLLIGDKGSWGQGFATQAIRAITTYGLNTLGLHRITAGCYADNIGSYKAFMKAGYTKEGQLKDYWNCNGSWQDEIIMHKIAGKNDA